MPATLAPSTAHELHRTADDRETLLRYRVAGGRHLVCVDRPGDRRVRPTHARIPSGPPPPAAPPGPGATSPTPSGASRATDATAERAPVGAEA